MVAEIFRLYNCLIREQVRRIGGPLLTGFWQNLGGDFYHGFTRKDTDAETDSQQSNEGTFYVVHVILRLFVTTSY